MSSSKNATTALPEGALGVSQPMVDWWLHHYLDSATPVARMQLAWMESLGDAMQLEAEFLSACAASGEKMARCLTDGQTLKDPAAIGEFYRDIVSDVADAHMSRLHAHMSSLKKVSELSQEFREQLWEEI